MAKSESTKYRLAEAMKTCMKTTSVDDITIRQIVEVCGVTRQTFYRNFLDKYDLINWYFDKLLLKSFEHMGEGTTVYDGLVKKFEYLKEEHLFFAAAFRSDDQNSLKEHDFELILEFYSNLIFQKTGRRPDAETSFLLEMYCRGSIRSRSKILSGYSFSLILFSVQKSDINFLLLLEIINFKKRSLHTPLTKRS